MTPLHCLFATLIAIALVGGLYLLSSLNNDTW